MTVAVEHLPSPNQGPRPADLPIDMLILHYTGMRSAAEAVARLRDPDAQVSSHYVVDEDGCILCLVDEARRAAHAGVSHWRGLEALNDRSIGIEIVNPGHEWGYRAFPEVQIKAVEALCLQILRRHPITPRNVVGHSDVAPDRKQDPGELFPWQRLAARGIGHWPARLTISDDSAPAGGSAPLASRLLAEIGFRIPEPDQSLAVVLTAFQRHWRPSLVSGLLDRGTIDAIEQVAASLRSAA